jgi:hypothetical protein
VTTSRLLSTGIDAQTCRLIVFDREVGSMPCRRHCEGLFVPALA